MRIVILDQVNRHIEVCPIDKELEESVENLEFDPEVYLSDKGYDISNLNYMVTDDDIPVFWYGEPIPYTSL